MPAATAYTTVTLENVDVECTHCGVRMTSHVGSGQVRYFQCPSCSRWTTSMYAEVLRADTKMRMRKPSAGNQAPGATAKERVEAWLASISVSDPYRTLGVGPEVSEELLRERYLTLARRHHPDRGGNADEMRRINDAYAQVLAHREQRKLARRATALGSGH
ncbi:MAG: J domain-containing protein [Myxococcota bacterium]